MPKTFLQQLSVHPGVRDAQAKEYIGACLQLEVLAHSAVIDCVEVLRQRVESRPIQLASEESTLTLRLLLSHPLETLLTIRQVASDGRATIAFVLMRTAEDELDLVAAFSADPSLIDEWARDESNLRPSDAAKRFVGYLQRVSPSRADTWSASRRSIRDALNPYTHVAYIGIQQNVHGQLKAAEQTRNPMHVGRICQPVARVYSYLFGLSYSILEALNFVLQDRDVKESLATIERQLPKYFRLIQELGISGP